ncbi:PRKCA-binding protein-like isoform X1 [Patiria miniata]|uniref:PRKCA-binding protein n=1 Tax=Patiria miniata TaxID=46514 RepID=A0A914AQ11_PATMI|nr:PRKCA-binding protein-like isoform X1 [Patiria miniata]
MTLHGLFSIRMAEIMKLDLISDNDGFSALEDRKGMEAIPGNVSLIKDKQNLVGISIGGGAPLCPCLYIVQVFDNTPASKDGTLASGDEIVGVNGKSVKGRTKVEVARMIQAIKSEVIMNYNKLHADPKQGKSLDIVLKKAKHRMVENMSSSTADALGLSRAILCNDVLIKKMDELQGTAVMYKGLMEHAKKMLKAFYDLSQTHKAFGEIFGVIGAREPQPKASEAFTVFADAHRNMEKFGIRLLRTVKPMLTDLGTFLTKAIPDTRLTIKKYADAKFEYLSYCLKVKEMDDEEYAYATLGEPLYRVETGNYEYRLILRCRQLARAKFAKLRSDVMVKLELLDQKHVQDIVFQLQRLVSAMANYLQDCHQQMKEAEIFPIEVDLLRTTINYDSANRFDDDDEDDDAAGEEVDAVVEAEEELISPAT